MNHEDEIRAFIAIPLPNAIVDYLTKIIDALKEILPVDSLKWVQPGNIHLTLKFLGNISNSTLSFLINKLEGGHQFSPFELKLNKLGAFPSIYKPQVIWVSTTTHPQLSELNQFIQNSTSIVDNENDSKTFSPHLTIARLRPGIKIDRFESIKRELHKNKEIEPFSFTVDHYCLFQSALTSNGPIYSEIRRFNL